MDSPDLIGNFEEQDFPAFRNPTLDTLTWGSKRHHIPVLLEVDVTAAREAISTHKKLGHSISFTGWIVMCIAHSVGEHRSVHALRNGRRRLVLFEDVDVAIIVERSVDQSDIHRTLPMPYIIRKANEKYADSITAEIRAAKQISVVSGDVQLSADRALWLTRLWMRLPTRVRNWLFWKPVFRDPFLFKRLMGTVSVTALGMVTSGGMNWGIPVGVHPLMVAVGAIAKRPGIVDGQIVIREYVGLTILFDHDVVDGAPVARFIKRLQKLLGTEYGLREDLNS